MFLRGQIVKALTDINMKGADCDVCIKIGDKLTFDQMVSYNHVPYYTFLEHPGIIFPIGLAFQGESLTVKEIKKWKQ